MIEAKKRGRPIDPAKVEAIKDCAAELFMEKGYTKVSLDQIAKAASVTKQTIYRYFKNKDELFSSIITDKCLEHKPSIEMIEDTNLHPKKFLKILAISFLDLLFSEDVIHMHTLVMSEAISGESDIPKLFYKSGPQAMLTMLEDYFKKKHVKKYLKINDPEFAADIFYTMLKTKKHFQTTLGFKLTASNKYKEELAEKVVNIFYKSFEK